ncbi:MAG TPA: SDR family NAD(P)-dependent oxidoreductase, partial [Anaeromyxobacteraceae bacterium]|nr:SDR family NAD(P)-dependent oxidoreductase [Anaeromyxobacteraceae bacterium]
SKDGSVEALAVRLLRAGERVDVLVNCAGVYPSADLLAEGGAAALREAMEVNFWGPLRTCRAFLPSMNAAGHGRVVNVSSGSGAFSDGLPGPSPYAVSKAALNALTVKLAEEARGDVKVNAACPGWVATRMGGPGAPRTVEQGADGIVWLATLPASGPSGGFFRDRRPIAW